MQLERFFRCTGEHCRLSLSSDMAAATAGDELADSPSTAVAKSSPKRWRPHKAKQPSASQYESFDTVLASHGIHTSVKKGGGRGRSAVKAVAGAADHGTLLTALIMPPLILTEIFSTCGTGADPWFLERPFRNAEGGTSFNRICFVWFGLLLSTSAALVLAPPASATVILLSAPPRGG